VVVVLDEVGLNANVAAQRAVLGLRAGIEVDAGAGPVGEAVRTVVGGTGPARRVVADGSDDVRSAGDNVAVAINSVGGAGNDNASKVVAARRTNLMEDVARDREAGLGAGDVEEAGAVDVADADVFDGLGLGDDDRVGRLGAGDGKGRNRGAEDKAL